MADKSSLEMARALARKWGLDDAVATGEIWGCECFEGVLNEHELLNIGIPTIILVSDGAARVASYDETMAYMDERYAS